MPSGPLPVFPLHAPGTVLPHLLSSSKGAHSWPHVLAILCIFLDHPRTNPLGSMAGTVATPTNQGTSTHATDTELHSPTAQRRRMTASPRTEQEEHLHSHSTLQLYLNRQGVIAVPRHTHHSGLQQCWLTTLSRVLGMNQARSVPSDFGHLRSALGAGRQEERAWGTGLRVGTQEDGACRMRL